MHFTLAHTLQRLQLLSSTKALRYLQFLFLLINYKHEESTRLFIPSGIQDITL